ncbi:MAG: ATP12 family chaperone protein [Alphaproteobacteria bacterium]
MKRFWTDVATVPVEDGFRVQLDGRDVRTPGKLLLTLPTQALATRIAEEWDAQGEKLDPASMPLTGFANAAIELIGRRRGEIVDTIAGYTETDLLCYRAEGPAELQARQHAAWQPVLDWAEKDLGAGLATTQGIVPVVQDAAALAALRAQIDAVDDWALTGLNVLTHGLGSAVLGLAVILGRLDPDEAFQLSQLDELWQESQWGQDAEAAQSREALRQRILTAAVFVDLTRL